MPDEKDPDIREQVWRAADPSGENRVLIEAAVQGGEEVRFRAGAGRLE